MDSTGWVCFGLLAALGALILFNGVIGAKILNELRIHQAVESTLSFHEAKDILERTMRGRVGAFADVVSESDRVERSFAFHVRGQRHTVVLRAEIEETEEPDILRVDVGVTQYEFPRMFGMPAPAGQFRRPSRIRRNVIRAIMKADPAARPLIGVGEWEHVKE